MPASSGTHIQPPTSTNLKQYNAAQPDTSCTPTVDMPASQPCSSTYTYLIYDLPTLQQCRQHSKIIMLYRITHQLASIPTATYITTSTRKTQHYILPYARTHVFKTSFFPSTIKIWNNQQPVITNSTTISQLRQALQSTPTSGRHGAPCSAGSEWTPPRLLASFPTHYVQPNSSTTTKHQIIQPANTPRILVLMLSYLLPTRWQYHTVVSDHTVSNLSPNNTKSYI